MPIQNVYLIRCPNTGCRGYNVLTRQILPKQLGGLLDPATDIWPITYLCHRCGQASEIPFESIRQEKAETRGHNQLVRYDFSSDQSGSLKHFRIFCEEPFRADGDIYPEEARQAIERVLKPSHLWNDSYGDRIHVSIEPLPSS
jgi:hypothetical protein